VKKRAPAPGQLTLPLTATATAAAVAPAAGPPPASAPLDVEPVFVRRRGARHYILRVLDDGTVRVTVPWWGSKRDARAFVASQAAWIATQQAQRAAEAGERRLRAGDTLLVDGEPRPLWLDHATTPARLRCGDDGDVIGRCASPGDDVRPLVERWLRRRALGLLPDQLLALAAAHGVTVTRISIRSQQTRWGSCSRRGSITLNWRLVQAPPFVREYVLVHELMHRRELNHSPRFWRHVAAACPRYVEARRWLRREGQTLF
jgi:predicted metal-dependent hydrolase